jgi:transposase
MLEGLTGLPIRETDFTDDRLGLVLNHLSEVEIWQALEKDLGQQLVRVYQLKPETIRVDATTISGYHEGDEDSLWQYGHSKDNPLLKQVKAMMATLDPLGLPLAIDVVSGEKADDPLYVPIMKRVIEWLKTTGLLFVGDSKMGALATRAYLQKANQYYLTPLALVGDTASDLVEWIEAAPATLTDVRDGDNEVIASGYSFTRQCTAEVDGETLTWEERVLVVRSISYALSLSQQLDDRLNAAQMALEQLTPPRGRGKRQIVDELTLHTAAQAILERYHVVGLLNYAFERQIEQHSHALGRGRGAANRPQQVVERVRYQITAVSRDEKAIAAHRQTLGWRVYVTNAPLALLSFEQAVLAYRQEIRIERGFGRLKGQTLAIAPVYVKRDDQVAGLTHLLSLAVRLLTLIEFVVRRALQQNQQALVGLHPENPRKASTSPTTERLLRAFSEITLTTIELSDRRIYHLTPLTPLQLQILSLLGLSADVYYSLLADRGAVPNDRDPLGVHAQPLTLALQCSQEG